MALMLEVEVLCGSAERTAGRRKSERKTESRSRIEDADFSVETANLAKGQIVSQAATAMLVQANASPKDVLKLLG